MLMNGKSCLIPLLKAECDEFSELDELKDECDEIEEFKDGVDIKLIALRSNFDKKV